MSSLSPKLPSFDAEAEDPYPESDRAAATIEALLKKHREVEAAINIEAIRSRPYDPETGEVASFFDKIWESAKVRNVGSAPPFLYFEQRGQYSEWDIDGWHDLPPVAIPIDCTAHRLPKVLSDSVYSCKRCGYATKRDDWLLEHIREDHPEVDGPNCIARDYANIDSGGASSQDQISLAKF